MFCKNPHCHGEPEFENTEQEKRFLEDFQINGEDLRFCRQCREMRRIGWRNERNLFKRKCDHSGNEIWGGYPPNTPFKVYDKNTWWKDDWDGLSYGRDIDLNRPFFQQFYELMLEVPRPSLIQSKNQNSDFSNDSNNNNDCYQVFTSDDNVNCHYGSFINCKDSMDCEDLHHGELCYDSINCNTCNFAIGSENSVNCSNIYFSSNLVNCHNCIFSFGLRDKKNCIFNTEVSPDVFMNFILQRQLFRRRNYKKAKEMFEMFLETAPQRYMYLVKTENSTGDKLVNTKDCENCYFIDNGVACSNVSFGLEVKDCMDCWATAYGAQRSFENQTCLRGGFNFVANFSNDCANCLYIDNCQVSQDCFGCIGLKNKKNCILNKQYSPEEYQELKPRLIEHLKKTGEWGQFFPLWMSPYPYNTTIANFYHPLTKEEHQDLLRVAEELWPPPPAYDSNYLWLDAKGMEQEEEKGTSPPDSIYEVKNEEVLNTIYQDAETGESFRITGRELALCQKLKVPLPDRAFRNRYQERLNRYNRRKLYARQCQKCRKDFQTTFVPEDPYIVFCEECFRKSLT